MIIFVSRPINGDTDHVNGDDDDEDKEDENNFIGNDCRLTFSIHSCHDIDDYDDDDDVDDDKDVDIKEEDDDNN